MPVLQKGMKHKSTGCSSKFRCMSMSHMKDCSAGCRDEKTETLTVAERQDHINLSNENGGLRYVRKETVVLGSLTCFPALILTR